LALSFFSCKQKKEQPQEDKIAQCLELKSVDRAFSEHSKKEGMKAAYMEYLDSNGVVLRANQMPIVGANAIDYLIQQNDADYILTWDPQQADIAESGELGFTYGIYLMRSKSVDTSIYGTYTNIWKRQSDGQWKLYLNTYNEGVGN
jgi:ketosteroid isomerase-like protein